MNLSSELLDKRRERLAWETRAIYDEAIEYGLSDTTSGIFSATSRVLLARMALLSEEERQRLIEIFDATSDYLEEKLRPREP